MNGKILITGAGGYIGSNAAEYFMKRGFEVTGMVHNKVVERFAASGAHAVKADLYEPETLMTLFAKASFDYVFHLAARASDVGREELFRTANFEAVKQLAALAVKYGARRFVYLSTSDVYGLHDFNGETEEQLSRDQSVVNYYPKYKIRSEEWIEANLPPEKFALVRPCFVWGNGDTTLTPRAISFLKSSPVVIHFGRWHGKNRCPLAHVENVCASLLAAATLDEMGGKAIHVLDPERTTLSGYYRMIRDRFLPEKRLREITMPVWTVRPAAKLSSGISTLLNRYVPIFDPSDYALDTIIHNLDFSSEMMCAMIGRAGEKVIHTNEGTF